MSKEIINSPAEQRKRALWRSGIATASGIALLLVVLMFEDRNGVEVTPPPEPVQAAPAEQRVEAPSPVAAAPVVTQDGPAVQEAAAVAEVPAQPVAVAPVCPEPAAAVAPKARPSSPPLGNGYMVQLGVFAAMQNAEGLSADLSARGFPAHVEGRVVLGPFPNKAAAEAVRARLKREGGTAGIIVPPRK